MKHLVSISFTSSANNSEMRFSFEGEEFRLSHFGADFSLETMKSLIKNFDGVADVIALQGLHPVVKIGKKSFLHRDSEELKSLVKNSRLVTGDTFRHSYMPWALRALDRENAHLLHNKHVCFYSGLVDYGVVNAMTSYTKRFTFFDPILHLGIKKPLKGLSSLERYKRSVSIFLSKRPLNSGVRSESKLHFGSKRVRGDIFVARATLLERFSLNHLSGKILMVDTVSPHMLRQLREVGVERVFQLVPDVPGLEKIKPLNFAVLEAIFQALKTSWEPLTEDELIEWIDRLKLKPHSSEVIQKSTDDVRNFAFIVHPLSLQDLFRHPLVKPLSKIVKRSEALFENIASHLPGILYGKITGIQSESTGARAEGLIYCIFDTPKMLLGKDPEKVYERLGKVCEVAADAGADIIGLGAYTKIVGDAGVSIARDSPIPVTTGNSLSAAATLWAARVACEKMGFLPAYKQGELMQAKVMVIGATGSIGAACARLLARVSTELVLCSRSPDKLFDLRDEIQASAPQCKVRLVTNPNKEAQNCDLIVTSTSAHDKRVLDIMSVKPGCVICDVSRPLDIREDDVIKRPDVLVIESGEIELPGSKVKVSCDLGTPDSVVYACLAETALLALEGRLESFTLSRHISHDKVREIYDLARKHGARLGAIRGHSGLITDQEIELCREHAQRALETWSLK